MAYNYLMRVDDLDQINEKLIKAAILYSYGGGIKNIAPLGMSGDNIILFGTGENGRKELISLRNYCGDVELLITDKVGNFLFYGRYDINLGLDFVVSEYYRIFTKVKGNIQTILKDTIAFDTKKMSKNVKHKQAFNHFNNGI